MGMKNILHHCDHLCSGSVVLIEMRKSEMCKIINIACSAFTIIGKPGNIYISTNITRRRNDVVFSFVDLQRHRCRESFKTV
jgi:hypothetical protein